MKNAKMNVNNNYNNRVEDLGSVQFARTEECTQKTSDSITLSPSFIKSPKPRKSFLKTKIDKTILKISPKMSNNFRNKSPSQIPHPKDTNFTYSSPIESTKIKEIVSTPYNQNEHICINSSSSNVLTTP